MGKKNWNKKNPWKRQLDSNLTVRWSRAISDDTKNMDFEQKNDDTIGSLPDDILCHIISFLPFESAVQTSFLSTRWKDLWKKNFLVLKGTMDDAFIAISSFLNEFYDQSHQPTSKWGFQFNLGRGSSLSVAVQPDKALHLDFSNVKHEFPWRFDCLLEINGSSHNSWSRFLWLYYQIHTPQPSHFTFKVKSLHLISVSYLSSGAISSMISNFQFLESLTIEKCHGLRSLHIKAGDSGLKKLAVLDCQQLESLHFEGYNLRSLRYRGRLICFQCGGGDSFWPWFNSFWLDDAMLDFRQGPAYNSIFSCGFKSILHRIKGVESLTLCKWVFEALICPMLPSPPFCLDELTEQLCSDELTEQLCSDELIEQLRFRLRTEQLCFRQLTELWWIDYSKERYNSNALISFLKLCPRLRRLYITIDPKSYRRTNKSNNSVKVMTRLPTLEDLKVVKLEGFPNEKEEIMLAERLKREFNVEPLIVAKSNYLNCVRLLVKSPDELPNEGKDSYKFIETRVEHLYDLCPKHVHMGL